MASGIRSTGSFAWLQVSAMLNFKYQSNCRPLGWIIWNKFDLGGVFRVARVEMTQRLDCCQDRFTEIEVSFIKLLLNLAIQSLG